MSGRERDRRKHILHHVVSRDQKTAARMPARMKVAAISDPSSRRRSRRPSSLILPIRFECCAPERSRCGCGALFVFFRRTERGSPARAGESVLLVVAPCRPRYASRIQTSRFRPPRTLPCRLGGPASTVLVLSSALDLASGVTRRFVMRSALRGSDVFQMRRATVG